LRVVQKTLFKCPLQQNSIHVLRTSIIDGGIVLKVSLFVFTSKEGFTCEHIECQAREAIDLALLTIFTLTRLIISPAPREHARLVTTSVDTCLVLGAPKVSQFDIAFPVDHDVLRLQVPVQQHLGMHLLQRRTQLKHQKHTVSRAYHLPRKYTRDSTPLKFGLAMIVVFV